LTNSAGVAVVTLPLSVPAAPSSKLFAICTPVEFGKRYSISDE